MHASNLSSIWTEGKVYEGARTGEKRTSELRCSGLVLTSRFTLFAFGKNQVASAALCELSGAGRIISICHRGVASGSGRADPDRLRGHCRLVEIRTGDAGEY